MCGFNWPPLSICASEPIRISPEAVKRAGPLIAVAMLRSCGEPLRSISRNAPSVVRTFFSPSAARGVGQPDKPATCGNATATLRPSGILPVALMPTHDCDPIALPTVGVGQPDSATVRRLLSLLPAALFPFCAGVPAIGVGQPVIAVSDMRRTDARRRERDTPEGVTQAFHVSVYKVDPSVGILARNLLSKDDWRAALSDEVLPGGP